MNISLILERNTYDIKKKRDQTIAFWRDKKALSP